MIAHAEKQTCMCNHHQWTTQEEERQCSFEGRSQLRTEGRQPRTTTDSRREQVTGSRDGEEEESQVEAWGKKPEARLQVIKAGYQSSRRAVWEDPLGRVSIDEQGMKTGRGWREDGYGLFRVTQGNAGSARERNESRERRHHTRERTSN